MKLLLSIDFEEAFHAENLRQLYPPASWDDLPCQCPELLPLVLEVLEALDVKITFFVLGWVAQRQPELVRAIADAGHEVASHGMSHVRAEELGPARFAEEARESKKLLESITGKAVTGFRAPSFSICDENLDTLAEAGYVYDSSFHPFGLHKNYGSIERLGNELRPQLYEVRPGLHEVALPVLGEGCVQLPIGGGAYFRFLPGPVYSRLSHWWLRTRGVLPAYTHPWELAKPTLELGQLSAARRLRQLHNTRHGLQRLVSWVKRMQAKGAQCITYGEWVDSAHQA